ncbi:hypothetical protein QQ056_16890 [Oscillatoria laete-virens NRMC-F 0139]|nr:hypothetical protein [Oscillatoria laete-virens]MDL5055210.1 hypothetical protein [Oscillatoria laete-virens NRMC-F 0139]
MDTTLHKVKSFTFVEKDILFDCPVCGKSLIVEVAGAGMDIACPQCQSMVHVPEAPDPDAPLPSGAQVSSSSVGEMVDTTHSVKKAKKEDAKETPAPQPTSSPAVPTTVQVNSEYIFDPKALEGLDEGKLQERLKDLKHLMKENHSQRLEASEYISHANLKLQREMLKLKKLEAKRVEYEKELAALEGKLSGKPA